MGKKGSWISAVKKALSPESKEKKDKQKSCKRKSKWFGKHRSPDSGSPPAETIEEVKLPKAENEQNKHAYSVALATAVAAEAAVAAAQAAAEVFRLTAAVRYSGKSKEEVAAIKIQTAFRGYLARRALRALRGLVRLKNLIEGQSVKHQATTTLRCMQTLARVQSQIRARRIRMLEENQALRRHLQQKHEKELEKFRVSSVEEDWNASVQSKEQIEANLQSKQEAAMRRERALAYSYSHQKALKNTSNPTFMDPNNPHWGWSWLERWMEARPWENKSTHDNSDHASIKTATSHAISVRELRTNSHRDNKPSPNAQKPSRQSPSTPPSKAPSVASKTRLSSPKGGGGGDDESRSVLSFRSERYRRHSIAGSSVRDDESLASSPAIPSYMGPTKSAKAKSLGPSPLGKGTPEKGSVGSAKKRLSFSSSPTGTRRHSGPPKLDTGSSVNSKRK
ncbi:protein IQ-DOMAIN 3-like isoform X1 [Actinidia eriantha]|uniref:protein IQ-DOMAIN 3-like isoform X1 n=1 Tax=Actinidia eriantha TaxID=165200 RepID=UPI00258F8113|nr:protein IQ-DOMAIN 3-like isoform X1 [Actinidia eriantha]XP_057478108.1 protein IQ-DOMAIN 3-like isoform X1 [Actinidia eriantha]